MTTSERGKAAIATKEQKRLARMDSGGPTPLGRRVSLQLLSKGCFLNRYVGGMAATAD
jgi:hypothetical protein